MFHRGLDVITTGTTVVATLGVVEAVNAQEQPPSYAWLYAVVSMAGAMVSWLIRELARRDDRRWERNRVKRLDEHNAERDARDEKQHALLIDLLKSKQDGK
jgi:hypothetical protein